MQSAMRNPRAYFLIGAFAIAAIGGGMLAARKYLPAIRAPFFPPPEDITALIPGNGESGAGGTPPPSVNETGMPLKLPPGFSISIFAKDLPGARVMRFDSSGNLWVSRTSQGAVTRLEIRDGRVTRQTDVLTGLRKPHGLAFDHSDPTALYLAEEHRLRRFRLSPAGAPDQGEELLDLPAGDGHFTRTIAFGPDDQLYVSVGSSCNVCIEQDERRAAILRYDPKTGQSEIFARGLRNAVFFTWDYVRGQMWATEMGRDWLGDNLPPDEITIVEQDKDYGWPLCYGKNVPDPFGSERVPDPCRGKTPSFADLPAHSAPLGLAFIPEEGWPEDYWYDLLVAYHGSWNRSQPTGYKVVRHKFDADGNYEGAEDFITGWLVQERPGEFAATGALGRPVDIIVEPGGVMYLSDDKAGVIYRIAWLPPASSFDSLWWFAYDMDNTHRSTRR